ncbi:MAG: hypothetical protein ACLUD2_10525 [Clostridium sp.]
MPFSASAACDVKGIEVAGQGISGGPGGQVLCRPAENHGVLISMACHEPEETCFCKAFGVDAAEPGGRCDHLDR